MKTTRWVWGASGLVWLSCGAFSQEVGSQQKAEAREPDRAVGYDDLKIATIKRGETTESELLALFGPPETRQVGPDGRASLGWGWALGVRGGGSLNVQLDPHGRVDSYAARLLPNADPEQRRTVEFVAETEKDLRAQMERWRREGWNVHSVSKPVPQPNGRPKRTADLSRNKVVAPGAAPYDDRLISSIRRGETAGGQLQEWFGAAHSRALQPDGRMEIRWEFGTVEREHIGELKVVLGPDGTVEAFAAHGRP